MLKMLLSLFLATSQAHALPLPKWCRDLVNPMPRHRQLFVDEAYADVLPWPSGYFSARPDADLFLRNELSRLHVLQTQLYVRQRMASGTNDEKDAYYDLRFDYTAKAFTMRKMIWINYAGLMTDEMVAEIEERLADGQRYELGLSSLGVSDLRRAIVEGGRPRTRPMHLPPFVPARGL